MVIAYIVYMCKDMVDATMHSDEYSVTLLAIFLATIFAVAMAPRSLSRNMHPPNVADANINSDGASDEPDIGVPVAVLSHAPPSISLNDVSVIVTAERDLTIVSNEPTNVLVTVRPPSGGIRQPIKLACVIDVSGSMGIEATITGTRGVAESHGLSLLDIAKHGVKTIIEILSDKDYLSIISFSLDAKIELSLTRMDGSGQALAESKLANMSAGGGTDLWEGLRYGLDSLRNGTEDDLFSHLILLTDGESPRRDHYSNGHQYVMAKLRSYKHENSPSTINTFGFGYNLDSKLLSDLATEGAGHYSFIPDAGFVGTAFAHSLSNLLVTMAKEVYLTLETDAGAELPHGDTVSGGIPISEGDACLRIRLGTLQYGQNRDIVLPMVIKDPSQSFLFVKAQYRDIHGRLIESDMVEVNARDATVNSNTVKKHRYRAQFTTFISTSILGTMHTDRAMIVTDKDLEKVQRISLCAIAEAKASPESELDDVRALIEDMCGQTAEALSQLDWFMKWGRHYLPSLMFAHRLQQCNNFKDPSVQYYGGELFRAIRDDADEIFCTFPPPQASARINRPTILPAPVNMSAYSDKFSG